MLLRAFDLPFKETVIPLDEADTTTKIHAVSPAGKVPIIVDGEQTIWDTFAIAEYLNDRFPDKQIWPSDILARAHARCISAEMHSGFTGLRSACPMNLGKRYGQKDRGAVVAADTARIENIWAESRDQFGTKRDGTFLYGAFSAADAMYAPVVTRLDTYNIAVTAKSRSYMDAVLNHPAFLEWREAALSETWIVGKDEVDEDPIENFRANMR